VFNKSRAAIEVRLVIKSMSAKIHLIPHQTWQQSVVAAQWPLSHSELSVISGRTLESLESRDQRWSHLDMGRLKFEETAQLRQRHLVSGRQPGIQRHVEEALLVPASRCYSILTD